MPGLLTPWSLRLLPGSGRCVTLKGIPSPPLSAGGTSAYMRPPIHKLEVHLARWARDVLTCTEVTERQQPQLSTEVTERQQPQLRLGPKIKGPFRRP